jgi:hypothetical protein
MAITRESYTVNAYGDGQYKIECRGVTYDTGESEILGYMPIMGDTSVLYKDNGHGYFVIGIPSKGGKPSFTKLNKSTGELWEKGIEKYWAGKMA